MKKVLCYNYAITIHAAMYEIYHTSRLFLFDLYNFEIENTKKISFFGPWAIGIQGVLI